ncbi:MAG: PTS sugar transporter subunit IIA [bacterium]
MRSDLVFLDIEAQDKVDVFRKIIDGMAEVKVINHPHAFLKEIIQREDQSPTSIGRGIALPHTRTIFVEKPVIAFARTNDAISFSDRPLDSVEFVFLMGTPKNDPNTYLLILGNLCRLLREKDFRKALRAAGNAEEIIALFAARQN